MPEDTTQPTTPASDTPGVIMPDPLATSAIPPPVGFSMPAPSADPTAAPADTTADASAPELPAPSLTTPANDVPPAAADTAATEEPIIPTSSFPTLTDTPTPASSSDDLATIKQQALDQLSPLVGHLDQTPEEKFRTTMMLIQASDNKDLVKDAFDAAGKITDDKARAQALLDVINEINYFTQAEHGSATS